MELRCYSPSNTRESGNEVKHNRAKVNIIRFILFLLLSVPSFSFLRHGDTTYHIGLSKQNHFCTEMSFLLITCKVTIVCLLFSSFPPEMSSYYDDIQTAHLTLPFAWGTIVHMLAGKPDLHSVPTFTITVGMNSDRHLQNACHNEWILGCDINFFSRQQETLSQMDSVEHQQHLHKQ